MPPSSSARPPAGDQVVSGLALGGVGDGGAPGRVERLAGRLYLGMSRAPGQILDGVTVQVARGEVERAERALVPQESVDEAHALEEFRPIDRGNQPEARDDVAHADVDGPLTLVLGVHDLVGTGVLRRDPRQQPGQRRRRGGILIAQSLKKLGRERLRQRVGLEPFKIRRCGIGCGVGGRQIVGQRIGPVAQRQPMHDPRGKAAQIVEQHDAQRDGDGPQLADGQWLDELIGPAESRQGVQLEAVVAVRDDRPGESIDPGISLQCATGELGELLVELHGKVAAHGLDVLIDDVIIVHEPFGGGRDAARAVHGAAQRLVRGAQDRRILAQACVQRYGRGIGRRDLLALRQRGRVPFQPLDAEHLGGRGLLGDTTARTEIFQGFQDGRRWGGWLGGVGIRDYSAVTSTPTSKARKSVGVPVNDPTSGAACAASRATATRIRFRPPTSALVGSNSTQPTPGR